MKAKTFRVALLIVQQSLFKEASTSQGMTYLLMNHLQV